MEKEKEESTRLRHRPHTESIMWGFFSNGFASRRKKKGELISLLVRATPRTFLARISSMLQLLLLLSCGGTSLFLSCSRCCCCSLPCEFAPGQNKSYHRLHSLVWSLHRLRHIDYAQVYSSSRLCLVLPKLWSSPCLRPLRHSAHNTHTHPPA